MEKKVNAILSDTLTGLIETLNARCVKNEDLSNVFQNNKGQYVAVFYS